jgi:hypothetical protein
VKKKKSIKKTAVAKPAKAKAKPVAKKVKTVAKKPVAKAHAPKAAVKAKTPLKKPVAAKATKPAKSAKSTKPAKPTKAVKPLKAPAKKAPAPALKKAPAKAAVAKSAKPSKPVKATAAKAPVKEVAAVAPAKAAKIGKVEKVAKIEKVKAEKPSKADKAAKAAAVAPADAFPALDPAVKRPAKPFFLEVKPGVERVIKRGDKSAASPVLDIQARRKGPAAEESSEELAERIERELQSQSFLKRNRMRPQLCTKCGINAVSPRFTIDRELGYCDSCAEILHLGETKEARRMEFNLSLKKEDPEAEAAPIEGPPADLEDEPLPEDLVD